MCEKEVEKFVFIGGLPSNIEHSYNRFFAEYITVIEVRLNGNVATVTQKKTNKNLKCASSMATNLPEYFGGHRYGCYYEC